MTAGFKIRCLLKNLTKHDSDSDKQFYTKNISVNYGVLRAHFFTGSCLIFTYVGNTEKKKTFLGTLNGSRRAPIYDPYEDNTLYTFLCNL